jgi:ribose 5-phosphate isomerase A
VEVVPFARPVVARALRRLGCDPVARGGGAYLTDNGNQILDCRFPHGIADARALEREIDAIPGVVETGLFCGLADVLIVGREDGGVDRRERPTPRRSGT